MNPLVNKNSACVVCHSAERKAQPELIEDEIVAICGRCRSMYMAVRQVVLDAAARISRMRVITTESGDKILADVN